MKQLTVLVITTILVLLFWVMGGIAAINKKITSDQKALEMATPIDGTIDVEYLEKYFAPAYEQ